MGHPRYRYGFEVKIHPSLLRQPLYWKKPRLIFVNSMSDLFHEKVPFRFIERIFETMENAHWHTFQILTKRAERLKEVAPDLPWPQNVWAGVTTESDKYISRIDQLRTIPASVKFLSIEPLLGPINKLDLTLIDWVIVGGESGPRAREVKPDWVRSIRDQCVNEGIPFFFKQWGGQHKSRKGRKLDGQIWSQMPFRSYLVPRKATTPFKAQAYPS